MDTRILAVAFALVLFLLTSGNPQAPQDLTLPQKLSSIFLESDTQSEISSLAQPPLQITQIPYQSPFVGDNREKLAQPNPITAKAAALFDISSGEVIFFRNIEHPLAIASITKLMTVLIAIENSDLENEIIILPDDLAVESHHPNLAAGDIFTLREALYFILVPSDNSLSQAVSRSVANDFVFRMNEKAGELGMRDTFFANPTGLDGNYSTAKDLFFLSRYIEEKHPLLFEISREPSISIVAKNGKTFDLKNTNALLGSFPGIIGGKTGYTPEAGGGLLLTFQRGEKNLLSVVLGSSDRFGDTKKLFDWYLQQSN
jgi:D-alanyl-D-alanine carboxypeptidase